MQNGRVWLRIRGRRGFVIAMKGKFTNDKITKFRILCENYMPVFYNCL